MSAPKLTFDIFDDYQSLQPHIPALRALEQAIPYPIDDGAEHFVIDHGPRYIDFFEQMGARARIMVARRGEELVGTLAGAWKQADEAGARLDTLYLGDLKLAPRARGKDVVPRMILAGMRALFQREDLRGWQLVYGAAMRGERGDVTRSARGASPVKWLEPLARQSIYFMDIKDFLRTWGSGPAPCIGGAGLDLSAPLSAAGAPLSLDTWGRKDFRIGQEQRRWELIHLPQSPARWGDDFGHYLERCAEDVARRYGTHAVPGRQICLAIDQRLQAPIRWLTQAHGIRAGATCTLYGFRVEALAPREVAWVHLSSSEI